MEKDSVPSPDRDQSRRDHLVAEMLAGQAVAAFAAQGDPFVIEHLVQVTSLGGSGTTALTGSFVDAGLHLPPGPGQWPHKHGRRAPQGDAVPEGFRVVYPLSDPRDAVLSVFRRGIQVGHWRALHLIEPHVTEPASLADLDHFLEAGVDEFDLAGHLKGWMDHPPGYPVMFLRFDHIDEAWGDVVDFVGLPDGHPRLSYEARASDWRSESPLVRERLGEMYGELAELIESFPAVQVI